MSINMFTQQAFTAAVSSQSITLAREGILLGVSVRFIATAAIGNRLLVVEVTDAADVVMAAFFAGALITASQTRTVHFGGSLDESAFVQSALRTAMGPTAVPAGWKVKCRDFNDIDSTAPTDLLTMAVSLQD